MEGLLIGIDGGGTHSTAVAAWPDGRAAAVAYGDGLNYHNVGVTAVRERLEGMARELCSKAGAELDQMCVGMSALDMPADEATTALFTGGMFAAEQLDLQSDAYVALMGLTRGEPGVIVICGTGSMLVTLDEKGFQHASGGWGYLLGDAGSSYTLAREGLIRAIDGYEGVETETMMWQEAMHFFRPSSPRGLIDCVYAPDFTPEKLAGFARCVLQCAAEGDQPALEITEKNMKRLARYAAAMTEKYPEAFRVGLYGGVFRHSKLAREMLIAELRRLSPQVQICLPDVPPEIGALIHLYRKRGLLTETVLQNLKKSYEELCHDSH